MRVPVITFIRHGQKRKIGKPNNLNFGGNKSKGPIQDGQNRLRSGSNKTKGPTQDSQNRLRSGRNKTKNAYTGQPKSAKVTYALTCY